MRSHPTTGVDHFGFGVVQVIDRESAYPHRVRHSGAISAWICA